ncbi:MAG: tetratricopeptide repeat protein [Pseudomonadota bacterium]
MRLHWHFLNRIVAASLLALVFCTPFSGPVGANEGRLDALMADLLVADESNALRIARDIEHEWSLSGSSAADLLLKRGTDALEAGEIKHAIEHLTALTDHAPDFAEGWHRRAMAYAQAEKLGPALADLERVLMLEPRHFNALVSLGSILQEVGFPDLAAEAFSQALALYPHHPQAQASLDAADAEIGGSEL